ncbi:MAG: SDR family oxidoreductase [Spirochaetia bacterium]
MAVALYYGDALPTKPDPSVGTVLVTGASGYVGGRLVPELLHRGYRVRILVRSKAESYAKRWGDVEVVEGDARRPEVAGRALEGIHAAYYLIHALATGPAKLQQIETKVAHTFRVAAAKAGVANIIYLGDLGDSGKALSRHLASRLQVANELRAGPVPVTELRAAVIVGSGSASYEIISGLVMRVPLTQSSRFLTTLCQPIAIRDVIRYLIGVMETPTALGRRLDIGGPDILSYRSMIRRFAKIVHKKVRFFEFPWASPRIYSYIIGVLTPVPPTIARSLIEGLRDEAVCRNNDILEIINISPIRFDEAVMWAQRAVETDDVMTRWSGARPRDILQVVHFDELPRGPRYQDHYQKITDCAAKAVFQTITRVGGDSGWFNSNFLWAIRGAIDRLLFGVGLSRGRRSRGKLLVGDVIDFWRVEELVQERRLLLRAEMKVPGLAWLEFGVYPFDDGTRSVLSITAYFEPVGFWGHVYWWFFKPFHRFIFNDMLNEIARKSGA